jgi:mRNA-degrading endonuclease RelE of RelBE toxin-antitoxin system
MSPRRGDRAAPPPIGGEYDVRFATSQAAQGWDELDRQARASLRRAFDALRADPRSRSNPERQHRLRGDLGTAHWKGVLLERWQFEVTGAGRIWYLIDDERRTVLVTYAGNGHPKATE